MTAAVRRLTIALCTLAAATGPHAQSTSPAPNKELEALQAHFETAVGRRHDQLFKGITTVAAWEQEKQRLRTALTRMLWHDCHGRPLRRASP